MINVKKWTLAALLCTPLLMQSHPLSAQTTAHTPPWTLQTCIDYALKENITLRKNRLNAQSTQVDVQTAQAALFPNLSFSTGQNMVNRPFQQQSSIVSGTEILSSNSKTSYNANYGLNAEWTLYNGNRRLNTIRQQKLNNRIALLDVATSETTIEEDITKAYMQILYATESVEINQNTLHVSQAQSQRGKALLAAGSISVGDQAQLEAQVATDNYLCVTAQATLQSYKLQLKQILELDEEQDIEIETSTVGNESPLAPLPSKIETYRAALTLRPQIQASKLDIEAATLGINIARAGYLPTLSLSAGIGTTNMSGTNFTFARQVKNGWNNAIGLNISLPIFNNRQTKSAVDKARLLQQTATLTLKDEEKSLFKTIETLWMDANSAQQQHAAATEKLRSVQTSYQLIDEQFRLGMKNTLQLLTEKNNLLQAQQQVLQAKYMTLLNAEILKLYSH